MAKNKNKRTQLIKKDNHDITLQSLIGEKITHPKYGIGQITVVGLDGQTVLAAMSSKVCKCDMLKIHYSAGGYSSGPIIRSCSP